MGFDMWLAAWEHGEEASLSTNDVKACFGPELVIEDDEIWQFDGGHVYVDEGTLSSLMISRPSQKAFERALKIMELGNVCLFWPGSRMCILDESVAKHLPPDVAEEVGIEVVKNLADIENHLKET